MANKNRTTWTIVEEDGTFRARGVAETDLPPSSDCFAYVVPDDDIDAMLRRQGETSREIALSYKRRGA